MLAGKGPGRQEFIIHRSGQEVAGGRGGALQTPVEERRLEVGRPVRDDKGLDQVLWRGQGAFET